MNVLDHVQMRVEELSDALESFRKILKQNTILLTIIQRKLEVTDVEIIEEERRLDAKLKRNSKGSK